MGTDDNSAKSLDEAQRGKTKPLRHFMALRWDEAGALSDGAVCLAARSRPACVAGWCTLKGCEQ